MTAAPTAAPPSPARRGLAGALDRRRRLSGQGLELLAVMVVAMWLLEAINGLDGNALDNAAGIYPRNLDHLWAIFTSPFLHAGFGHLTRRGMIAPMNRKGIVLPSRIAHGNVSGQGHLTGALGGIFAAWLLAARDHRVSRHHRSAPRIATHRAR
jgi:membrane associated rhomboid family serine protease